MRTVAVTPVLGEFGYMVFDIQPQVRWWLRHQQAERKIVFASRKLSFFFDEATEIIEPPAEMLPTVPATARSVVYQYWQPGHPEREKIERLVAWAKNEIEADQWLDIPYFEQGLWRTQATNIPLRSKRFTPPEEPYLVMAARDRSFDDWRNWPKQSWDELVHRIKDQWQLPVYMIGAPPSTYYPAGAVPQMVDEQDRLEHSVMLLNHAIGSISSNSGPTHLSLMAECPTFAWGEPYLKVFMEQVTNPLQTPCHLYPVGWEPTVDQVWEELNHWKQNRATAGGWQPPVPKKVRISMCMIARDSARTISAALQSVKPWVDEMVVVDTGSTDDTPAIAENLGARVSHFPWPDSFAEARNESIRQSQGQWIFWMDSDDTISPENGRKLRELVDQNHPPALMGFVAQVYCPSERGGRLSNSATVVDHVKLFRNMPALRFTGRIHEQILPALRRLGGDVEWTDICVTHSGSDQSPTGRQRKHQRDLRLLELELKDDPDSTFALFNMGMTLVDMGQFEEALAPLARSLQLADPSESHVRKLYALLAQAYCELERHATAHWTCVRGLEVCPQDAELLFRKGTLELTLNAPAEAVQTLSALLQCQSARHFSSIDNDLQGSKAWNNLAIAYEQLRRPADACDCWEQVVRRDPENRSAWRAFQENSTKAGRQIRFTRTADAMLTQTTSDITRKWLESRLAVLEGEPQRAMVLLAEICCAADVPIDILDDACRISFEHHCLDQAESWLMELTQREPANASAWLNLAQVWLWLGKYESAQQAAQTSLTYRPNYKPAQTLLEEVIRLGRPVSDVLKSTHIQTVNVAELEQNWGIALSAEPKALPTSYTPAGDSLMLFRLARAVQPQRILEIGTAHGHTTLGLASNCPDAEVVTVDICQEMELDVPASQKNEVLPRVKVGLAYENRGMRITQIIGDSGDSQTLEHLSGIDFVFIDGNHSKESIIADTLNVLRICKPGSLIVWHDFKDDPSVQTIEALTTLARDWRLNICHIAGTTLAVTQVRPEDIESAQRHGELCSQTVATPVTVGTNP